MTRVVIFSRDGVLVELDMREVPNVNDRVTVDGRFYHVVRRTWDIGDIDGVVARVEVTVKLW